MTNPAAITLYRNILRLHRKLPPAMKSLGDEYVKSEFKRHKNSEAGYVIPFMIEWNNYLNLLQEQVNQQVADAVYGKKLESEELDKFSKEQVGQLYVLKKEAKSLKPPSANEEEEIDSDKKR
jgi:hypothetical protein